MMKYLLLIAILLASYAYTSEGSPLMKSELNLADGFLKNCKKDDELCLNSVDKFLSCVEESMQQGLLRVYPESFIGLHYSIVSSPMLKKQLYSCMDSKEEHIIPLKNGGSIKIIKTL